MRSYSAAPSPSHTATGSRLNASSIDRHKEVPVGLRSVESLCLFNDPQQVSSSSSTSTSTSRNYQRNARLRSREQQPREDWGNELSTLELKPPSGFMDAHETSEAECDIDMKLKLDRKRSRPLSNSLSKSPKDFTITV